MVTVDELIEDWVKMWSSYDLDQVERLFLADSRLTYFSSEREGVIQGLADVREHHRKFGFTPGGKPSENRLWLEDVLITYFENASVVTALWYFRRNGSEKAQRGPVTFVCFQQGNEWRLGHLHFAGYATA